MSMVDRVLMMDFNKLAGVVVNLLIKSHRCLVGVNLFHVPRSEELVAYSRREERMAYSTNKNPVFSEHTIGI